MLKEGDNINAYLMAAPNVVVQKALKPLTQISEMSFGNKPFDGGCLLLIFMEVEGLVLTPGQHKCFIRRIYCSAEFIRG